MKSLRRNSFMLLIFAAAMPIMSLHGQSSQPAPIPSDFATAQTAFLANAGAPSLGAKEQVAVRMMYEGLYQQLASWKRYKLVGSPRAADLAFELSLGLAVGSASGGSSLELPFMKLDVRDVHTHALLWTIDEPIRGAFREKAFQKNVDDTVGRVMADLKQLAAGQQPGPGINPAALTKP